MRIGIIAPKNPIADEIPQIRNLRFFNTLIPKLSLIFIKQFDFLKPSFSFGITGLYKIDKIIVGNVSAASTKNVFDKPIASNIFELNTANIITITELPRFIIP